MTPLQTPPGETWHEDYQLPHYKTSLRHCQSRRTAIDCGAHIGIFTRRYARSFDRVIAIEPITPDLVVRNTQEFRNTRVIPKAAYSHSDAKLYAHNPGSLTAHTELTTRHIHDAPVIRTITIDDLALQAVDIIKIDTQGLEWQVVQGAGATIAACRPILHIETRDRRLLDRICDQFHYQRRAVHKKDWVLGHAG